MPVRDMPMSDMPGWDVPVVIDARPAASRNQAAAHKQIVTIRLDADMLDWFKGAGPGYQTRINQILRQHMADHGLESSGQPN